MMKNLELSSTKKDEEKTLKCLRENSELEGVKNSEKTELKEVFTALQKLITVVNKIKEVK